VRVPALPQNGEPGQRPIRGWKHHPMLTRYVRRGIADWAAPGESWRTPVIVGRLDSCARHTTPPSVYFRRARRRASLAELKEYNSTAYRAVSVLTEPKRIEPPRMPIDVVPRPARASTWASFFAAAFRFSSSETAVSFGFGIAIKTPFVKNPPAGSASPAGGFSAAGS